MNNRELANKAIDIAKNYKTLYVMGCFGAPLNETNKQRYLTNHAYNTRPARQQMIKSATADTFGFDCVNLIKAILWGWTGDKTKSYGGAKYGSNGVPDIDADVMISKCKDVSTDFSRIEVGEAVWMPGHIGIYIGDGLAVECTPTWKNNVQITACNKTKNGYNKRTWTKHGKIPYITYEEEKKQELTSANDIIWELMNGKHKVEILDAPRAVKQLEEAKKAESSLYWILKKIVNA